MEIEISFRYSQLDNENQFGIFFIDETELHRIYIRWVFYYLGKYLGEKYKNKDLRIYPFSLKNDAFKGKVLKKYKYCNDAQRQAKMIYLKINKTDETIRIHNSNR